MDSNTEVSGRVSKDQKCRQKSLALGFILIDPFWFPYYHIWFTEYCIAGILCRGVYFILLGGGVGSAKKIADEN